MIILSIGNNTIILQALTNQLKEQGYNATWTSHSESVSTLYSGSDFDVVAFGGAISDKTKLFIKKIFSKQNPAIIFVDGIAPIPSLLSEQIRHTIAKESGRNGNPLKEIAVKPKTSSIDFTVTVQCQLKIKLYHLSLLYKATEKILTVEFVSPGNHSISIDKKEKTFFGSQYVVVTANNKPLLVERL